jgi:hypothetical protein
MRALTSTTALLAAFSLLACNGSSSTPDQGTIVDQAATLEAAAPDGPTPDKPPTQVDTTPPQVDTTPPDTAKPDAVSHTCPPSGKEPADGDACNHIPTLQCTGSGYVETCWGSYGGQRKCTCMSGKWACPNIFCPSWCPATLQAAQQGPACTVKPTEKGGMCYYKDSSGKTVLCGCNSGKVDCS